MKNWISTIVSTILFLGVYILLDYLFGKSIDWEMAVISSIIFAVFEIICQIYRNKKSNK